MRVSLVGAGHYGRMFARRIAEHPDLELDSIVETDPKSTAGADFDCDVKSLGDALAWNPDFVVITTPAPSMFEIAKSALYCGVPVLLTKPGVMNLEEARVLQRISRESFKPLVLDYTAKATMAWDYLKREIPRTKDLQITTKRTTVSPQKHGVDAILDLAVHDIALILDLVPNPSQLSCVSARQQSGGFVLALSDEQTTEAIVIAQHNAQRNERSMHIEQTGCTWHWDQKTSKIASSTGAHVSRISVLDHADSITRQLNRMIRTVNREIEDDKTAFGHVMRIVEQAKSK